MSTLQSNSNSLQLILDIINNLPSAYPKPEEVTVEATTQDITNQSTI